jgi:hypothetical protein
VGFFGIVWLVLSGVGGGWGFGVGGWFFVCGGVWWLDLFSFVG